MNPQGLSTWAEQDNWVDKTQDTIALNEKAEKIADLVGTEKAKRELQELKQITIAKLNDLQFDKVIIFMAYNEILIIHKELYQKQNLRMLKMHMGMLKSY